jgi:serine/threonine-protein kinase HipA
LAPAYDLLCTALHIDDSGLALHNGLYDGDMEEESYLKYGLYTRQSFMVFAAKIGVQVSLAEKIIEESMKSIFPAMAMIERSYLGKETKEKFKEIIGERHRRFTLK